MRACRSPQSTMSGSLKYAEGLKEPGSQTSRRRIVWALALKRQREDFHLGAGARATTQNRADASARAAQVGLKGDS